MLPGWQESGFSRSMGRVGCSGVDVVYLTHLGAYPRYLEGKMLLILPEAVCVKLLDFLIPKVSGLCFGPKPALSMLQQSAA